MYKITSHDPYTKTGEGDMDICYDEGRSLIKLSYSTEIFDIDIWLTDHEVLWLAKEAMGEVAISIANKPGGQQNGT